MTAPEDPDEVIVEELPGGPSWLAQAGPEYQMWWSVIVTAIKEAMGRVVPDGDQDPEEAIREAADWIQSDAFEALADQVGFSKEYGVGRVRKLVAANGYFHGGRPRRAPRRNKVEINGEQWTMLGIAKEAGVSPGTVSTRLANGWEGDDLFRGPGNRGPAQGTTP